MSRNEGCDVDLHLNHIQRVKNIFNYVNCEVGNLEETTVFVGGQSYCQFDGSLEMSLSVVRRIGGCGFRMRREYFQ